jgi:Domain of unknown function (DUF4150)/GHH signature containing HNH/Endo VII superfamily nuclease toxin  2
MSNQVYANGMEVSCKQAAGKSICAFPDVCMTPPETIATPAGVPIPYPNTGMASDTTSGSTSVNVSGQEVMLKNKSYFKRSTGDEAGCAAKKGVMTSVNMGKVYFAAWSMDVLIEGENVVRHLDMTTHNHGSNPNTGPWPYLDAMAMNVEGHPCQSMAEDIKAQCTGEKDYGAGCCDARKCLVMPKEPNRCCKGSDDKQMTGHHLLPSKEFVAHADRGAPDASTKYVSNKAPCLCVEGTSHSKRTEHGQVGCNYTVKKQAWATANPGKAYTLSAGCEVGAESAVGKVNAPAGAQGCTKACLQKQLDDGHSKMGMNLKPSDPLPRANQPSTGIELDS